MKTPHSISLSWPLRALCALGLVLAAMAAWTGNANAYLTPAPAPDGPTPLDYLASLARRDGAIAYSRGSSPTPGLDHRAGSARPDDAGAAARAWTPAAPPAEYAEGTHQLDGGTT